MHPITFTFFFTSSGRLSKSKKEDNVKSELSYLLETYDDLIYSTGKILQILP